jgi:hypothetical protein
MRKRAAEEAKRREPYIQHHFEVEHMDGNERNIVGFLGEFACCEYLGINWQANIREDYLTIDNGDIHIGKLVIDVKTETIPENYCDKVVERTVDDDETFGRRLITEEQVPLLEHYDYVIFGAFKRNDLSTWYPIGCIRTKKIMDEYEIVTESPNGKHYPVPGLPIRTSELHKVELIRDLINNQDNFWGYSSRGYYFYHSDRQCRTIARVKDNELEIFHLQREAREEGYLECQFCKREN